MDQSNRGTIVSASLLVISAQYALHAQQDLFIFYGEYRGNGKQHQILLEALFGPARGEALQLPGLRYLQLQGQNYLYEYIMLLHFGTTTVQTSQ